MSGWKSKNPYPDEARISSVLNKHGMDQLIRLEDDLAALHEMAIEAISEAFLDISDNGSSLDGLPMRVPAQVCSALLPNPKDTVIRAMHMAGWKADDDNARMIDETIAAVEEVGRKWWKHELRTMDYKAYLRTDHWKQVRATALESAGHRCRLCNAETTLHVHHRTYERRGDELPEDVIALCDKCHQQFHDNLSIEPSPRKESPSRRGGKLLRDYAYDAESGTSFGK